MLNPIDIALASLMLLMAALYSSVGHGGGSGYLAAMALFGVEPAVMKPTALSLNILVSAVAFIRFYRVGCFSWRIFWPFAVTSVPMAALGGWLTLPGQLYNPIVGVVLLYAAARLLLLTRVNLQAGPVCTPSIIIALLAGAGIGLLSGLTGVGGGIFLSPLLLLGRWADVRHTAGVSAAFIFVNSVAGLAGHVASLEHVPAAIALWGPAALIGGLLGSWLGSRRLADLTLRRALGLVLVVAGVKMIFA